MRTASLSCSSACWLLVEDKFQAAAAEVGICSVAAADIAAAAADFYW